MRLREKGALLVFALCVFTPWAVRAEISIVGGLTYEKVAAAGETYRGFISMKNMGDRLQEVKIYQTDYSFCCDGSSIYDGPGQAIRSNANWITFSPRRVSIPPQEEVSLNYIVQVPDDEHLMGTYWSMLMVEQISPNLTQARTTEECDLGIRQVVRYGIQMVTHIGNTGICTLKFLDTRLLREQDIWLLWVDIENTGERWLRPSVWAELYDHQGSLMGKFEGGRFRIYPETSVRYKIDLSNLPAGDYKAIIVADCGDDLFGATYTLKLER